MILKRHITLLLRHLRQSHGHGISRLFDGPANCVYIKYMSTTPSSVVHVQLAFHDTDIVGIDVGVVECQAVKPGRLAMPAAAFSASSAWDGDDRNDRPRRSCCAHVYHKDTLVALMQIGLMSNHNDLIDMLQPWHIPREQFHRSIHVRQAQFPRDVLAIYSRGCYEETVPVEFQLIHVLWCHPIASA